MPSSLTPPRGTRARKPTGKNAASRAGKPDEPSPPWSPRQRAILDVAAELFASLGVDRTSMDDIGHGCGLEKPSLYHHFPSKKAILSGVLALGVEDLIEDAYAVLAAGIPDPRVKLEQLLQSHCRNFDRKLPHVKVFLLESRSLDQPERRKYLERRREYEKIIVDVICEGQEEGVFRAGDPTILAYGLLGMFNWMVQWYDPRRGTSAEQIGQALVEAALGAVRP
jgi:TetR/AcrR family transcriptional regulator, cholesterol catabolism regulator